MNDDNALNSSAKLDLAMIDLRVNSQAVLAAMEVAIQGLLDLSEAARVAGQSDLAEKAMAAAEATVRELEPVLIGGEQ